MKKSSCREPTWLAPSQGWWLQRLNSATLSQSGYTGTPRSTTLVCPSWCPYQPLCDSWAPSACTLCVTVLFLTPLYLEDDESCKSWLGIPSHQPCYFGFRFLPAPTALGLPWGLCHTALGGHCVTPWFFPYPPRSFWRISLQEETPTFSNNSIHFFFKNSWKISKQVPCPSTEIKGYQQFKYAIFVAIKCGIYMQQNIIQPLKTNFLVYC